MRIEFLSVVARTLQRGCACCVIAVWMCCVVAALLSEKVACVQCCSILFPGRIVAFWQAYSSLQQPQPYRMNLPLGYTLP